MKKRNYLVFGLLLMLICQFGFGQTGNETRIKELPGLIQKAVKEGDYKKAAQLKKENELRLDLKKALSDENYSKAAELKNQIESGGGTDNSGKIAVLEKELSRAINDEEYGKAAQIKKEIAAIQNGTARTPFVNQGDILNPNVFDQIEFVNQIYYYSKSDGKINVLEKGNPETKSSTKAAPGYAQSTSYYVIDGVRSPIRLDGGSGHYFVVKISPGMDPTEMIRLVKFEILGKKLPQRHMAAFSASGSAWGWGGGGKSGAVSKFDIPLTFQKIGDGIYEISPRESLENGEYTFYYPNKMYAFGID